jgi:hypothetical protein
MAEAKKQGWHVISIKNDWRQIFPFEEKAKKNARKLPGNFSVEQEARFEGAFAH